MKQIIIVPIFFLYSHTFAQHKSSKDLCIQIPQVSEWGNSVGIVYKDLKARDSIGSAFVITPHEIMTCAHVLLSEHQTLKSVTFQPAISDTAYFFTVKQINYNLDLAILESKSSIFQPVKLGKRFNVVPDDTVYYIGLNTNVHGCCLHKSKVLISGKMSHFDSIVDFIQFSGEGIPGYSGGPLFTDRGEVVGIISQAFYYRPVKANPNDASLRNNAISIFPFIKKTPTHPFKNSLANSPSVH